MNMTEFIEKVILVLFHMLFGGIAIIMGGIFGGFVGQFLIYRGRFLPQRNEMSFDYNLIPIIAMIIGSVIFLIIYIRFDRKKTFTKR